MTKAELVGKIAKDTKLSRASSEKVLNTIVASISNALKRGVKVTLVGFGTFSVVKRKAREGRNPRSGITIRIPARKTPKFRAGKGLKDTIK
jgi:DNA-binding protein HU-beta